MHFLNHYTRLVNTSIDYQQKQELIQNYVMKVIKIMHQYAGGVLED